MPIHDTRTLQECKCGGGLREIADEVKSGRVLLVRGSMIYSAGPKEWVVGDATAESPSGMGA
jgi:hypothetical protein